MDRLSIDIMGISEMRWPDSGQCTINNHQIYYSGNPNGEHIHGVGIILNEKAARSVMNFVPISERILLIQLDSVPTKTNIIQVYAPTADKSDETNELFYEDLNDTLKNLRKEDITLVIGDFNAKIGNGECNEVVGPFGLGVRNERGERLNVFAMEHQLVITNTFFKLPARGLYTWRSPQDTKDHIVRNQIDYIMINKRYRNSIIAVKTYPGADINSDHNPLVGSMRLKLKKMERKKTTKYDLRQLKKDDVKQKVQNYLKREIPVATDFTGVEEDIKKLQNVNQEILDKYLRPETIKKKHWMTSDILELMERRRKVKDKDHAEYRQLDKQIKRAIRTQKNKWFEAQCREIEILESKYDSFNLHKKVKEAAGLWKPKKTGCITDDRGKPLVDVVRLRNEWRRYVEQSFDDDRRDYQFNNACNSGPPIMFEEVKIALKGVREGKAAGPDNLYSEIFKLMDDEQINWLTTIFNNIYSTGQIPTNWLKSTFVTLPKKPNAKKFEDHRIIALMSHLLKIFLKIIHKRIYNKCEEHISPTQFGFRDALGTREALFATQVLFQRCRDVNCGIYLCFVDYQRAFDRVKHDELMIILKNTGIDDKDLRIIHNLYYHQKAALKIHQQVTEEITIKRGVRQGCILSPLLFNVYSEHIMREALDDIEEGVLMNGERLNNIRYADDTIVFADTLEGLQILVTRLAETSQRYGLDFNIKKTKYMVITKNPTQPGQITVNQQPIERVTKYTYLGTNINDQWDHSQEIKQRIEKARSVFVKMRSVFNSHDLPLQTKIRLLRCYVFTVLLYGVESWTLTERTMKRVEAFEMWCYRRILRISWLDHVTNQEVLRRMDKECEILTNVKCRKLEYLGHIMRNENRYKLLQLILQGKVCGKRDPGRRRISWLQNLRKWYSLTTTQLFRAAVNKVRVAMLIANIRNG